MIRFASVVLILAAPALAADPDPRSWKDVFGRPRPHGEPVSRAFVGLHTGRTNLHFGQPMAVELFAVPATENGPYVHPRLTHSPNVKLDLTDAAGRMVPFRLADGGTGGGPTGEWCPFTLWPTKDHAAGIHWKPGKYTLKATVTNPDEPANPNTLPGTFKANELRFTVREFGAALDTWDGKGELRTPRPLAAYYADDVFLYVAGLDEASTERLREQCKWEKAPWRVAAARFAPVTVPQDRKLTDAEAKKLLAGLTDDDPAARVRALVSVPSNPSPEVLAATIELLSDPYKEWAGMVDPVQVHPVSTVAAGALSRLGPVAVEPLIAYAGDGDGQRKALVASILGPIGPTEAGEKFLLATIKSDTDSAVYRAQAAAAEWGKGGLGVSRAIVADPKIRKEIRRGAIEAIGKHGDLKTDGPTLRKLLNSAEMDTQWAAVTALGRMKDVESLPEFERIARDGQINQNTRYPAVRAVLTLADAKTGDQLLHDLVNSKDDRLRGFALKLAGERKVAGTLPLALAALDDSEWFTRVMADYALRGLAGDRAGVGYDPRKPDAKLWRDYWAKKEKK